MSKSYGNAIYLADDAADRRGKLSPPLKVEREDFEIRTSGTAVELPRRITDSHPTKTSWVVEMRCLYLAVLPPPRNAAEPRPERKVPTTFLDSVGRGLREIEGGTR